MEEINVPYVLTGTVIALLLVTVIIVVSMVQFHRSSIESQKKHFENVLKAIEDEKNRIGQTLHDDFGPLLATLKLNLVTLMHEAEDIEYERLNVSTEYIDNLLFSMRSFSHDLCAIELSKNKFSEAMEKRIELVQEQDWKIVFNGLQTIDNLDVTIQTGVFRILNECLKNSISHSKGNSIWLNISSSNRMLHVSFKDNGIGQNLGIKEFNGVGSNGIVSRVNLMSGNLRLNPNGFKGFQLDIDIPISKK